jgi:hypothetical protein
MFLPLFNMAKMKMKKEEPHPKSCYSSSILPLKKNGKCRERSA